MIEGVFSLIESLYQERSALSGAHLNLVKLMIRFLINFVESKVFGPLVVMICRSFQSFGFQRKPRYATDTTRADFAQNALQRQLASLLKVANRKLI